MLRALAAGGAVVALVCAPVLGLVLAGGAGEDGEAQQSPPCPPPGSTTADGLPAPQLPVQQAAQQKAVPVPTLYRALYAAAGVRYGIPWTLLAGIGMEETRHGATDADSYAGAQGPMQFMPQTFDSVGVDGDGDGVKDVHNPADAIFSAANYLVLSGAKQGPDGVRRAIFAYNHADWYVNDVLTWASQYGGGTVVTGVAGDPGCTPGGPGPGALNADGSAIVAAARRLLGTRYGFAMGNENGPVDGVIDCSGLVMYAVFQATGIRLPHMVSYQSGTNKGQAVPYSRDFSTLQPGDVVGFCDRKQCGDLNSGNAGGWYHVAIYVGDKQFIHATDYGVRITSADGGWTGWNEGDTISIRRFARTRASAAGTAR